MENVNVMENEAVSTVEETVEAAIPAVEETYVSADKHMNAGEGALIGGLAVAAVAGAAVLTKKYIAPKVKVWSEDMKIKKAEKAEARAAKKEAKKAKKAKKNEIPAETAEE